MKIAISRINSQGQISVPLEVCRRLGVGPGATIQLESEGEAVVVRRAGKHSFADVRRAFFPEGLPEPHDLQELKKGIEDCIRAKHSRR